MMIMRFLVIIISFFALVVLSETLVPTDLRDDEMKSDYVQKAVEFATSEIYQQKLVKGEYNKCTTLKGQVLAGRKQAISGIKYYLQLKVLPSPVSSDDCRQKTSSKWQAELCETEVLWQAWKKPDMQLERSVCLPVED